MMKSRGTILRPISLIILWITLSHNEEVDLGGESNLVLLENESVYNL